MKRLLVLLSLVCVLNGNTQSRRLLIAPPRAAASGVTADLWETFQFTGVLSATSLQNNDAPATGTWTISADVSRFTNSTAAELTTIGPVNGTSDSGTLGLEYNLNGTAANYAFHTISSPPGTAPVSGRFAFKYTGFGTDGTFTLGSFYGASYVMRVQFRRNAGAHNFGLENGAGSANWSTTDIAADTWYYVTFLSHQNATCSMKVFDSTWNEISNQPSDVTGQNQASNLYVIGSLDTTIAQVGTFFFDDLLIDWTDATNPLGP